MRRHFGKADPKVGQGGELLTVILGQPVYVHARYVNLHYTFGMPNIRYPETSLSPRHTYLLRVRAPSRYTYMYNDRFSV